MTSITTTPVTPRPQTGRIRADMSPDTTTPVQPLVPARATGGAGMVSGVSSAAQDGFLSKVFDILHKMNGDAAPIAPTLDAEDLQAVVSRIDADGDGKVTSAEFVAARPEHISEDEAASLFSSIDTEGRGVLDVSRLTSAFAAQPAAEDANAVASLDVEGDLGVDRAAFLASMPHPESPDDAVKTLLRLLGGKDGETDAQA